MSAIPAYQAATTGQPGNAGAVNQFLGAHNASFVYQGTQQSAQTTASTVYLSTAGQWIGQAFTTAAGQTTVGSVMLQVSTVGGSPFSAAIPPLTVGIYADNNGSPTGSALGSATVNDEYVYSASYWVLIPLAATGLTAGTPYHLVTQPVGTSSAYYVWHQSNQTLGAVTSTDGANWTIQGYGMTFQVYDQATTGQLQFTVDDTGTRWARFTYGPQNRISQITEYTSGQTAASYLYSTRSLSYSNGLVTGVS